MSSGQMLQGPETQELERRMAALSGRAYGVAVGSCTDALFFALTALGIGAGDEVLVTDFSFVASASAILRTGATPVFVDIADDYMLDLDKAESSITTRTKAMVFVPIYGAMRNPVTVEAFARDHEFALVEDAAQALGAKYRGRPAGSVGCVSCISFDPTKVLSAPGSGGIFADRRRRGSIPGNRPALSRESSWRRICLLGVQFPTEHCCRRYPFVEAGSHRRVATTTPRDRRSIHRWPAASECSQTTRGKPRGVAHLSQVRYTDP